MSELHHQLSKIDQKANQLKEERVILCEKIHEKAVEAARREALEYKTVIQNGDYGFFDTTPVFFVEHRGKIILVGPEGTHPEMNMNNRKRESDFIKHGNILEEMAEDHNEL